VLPVLERELGAGAVSALARSADLAREDADALDELAATLAAEAVTSREPPTRDAATVISAPVHLLANAPAAIRNRALRRIVAQNFGSPLDRRHVLAIATLLTAQRGRGPVFVPGVRVARTGDTIVFASQIGSPRAGR